MSVIKVNARTIQEYADKMAAFERKEAEFERRKARLAAEEKLRQEDRLRAERENRLQQERVEDEKDRIHRTEQQIVSMLSTFRAEQERPGLTPEPSDRFSKLAQSFAEMLESGEWRGEMELLPREEKVKETEEKLDQERRNVNRRKRRCDKIERREQELIDREGLVQLAEKDDEVWDQMKEELMDVRDRLQVLEDREKELVSREEAVTIRESNADLKPNVSRKRDSRGRFLPLGGATADENENEASLNEGPRKRRRI